MSKSVLQGSISLLERITEIAIGIVFSILIVTVVVQVGGRSGLFDSPVWTEELSRFSLLYLAALGIGLSLLRGDLVNVDVVCESLPGRGPWYLRLLSAVITAGLCLSLIPFAWKYTAIGIMQTSPALGVRMDFIHASVLVLLCSLALFSLIRVVTMLLVLSDGLPVRSSQLEKE